MISILKTRDAAMRLPPLKNTPFQATCVEALGPGAILHVTVSRNWPSKNGMIPRVSRAELGEHTKTRDPPPARSLLLTAYAMGYWAPRTDRQSPFSRGDPISVRARWRHTRSPIRPSTNP